MTCDDLEPVNIFIHLLNEEGEVVAQHDGFDVWAASLRRGDVVAQLHPIPLTTDFAHATSRQTGKTPIQVGVYSRDDRRRLPAIVNGAEAADRLWLSPWR